MKRIFYTFSGVLIFLLISAFGQRTSYKDMYIDTYCVLAIQQMQKSGIPASIILGQAIIESNFGQSQLATKAKNHFGIKCKSYWEGEKYYHKDDDYENGKLIASCFRSYDTSIESFKDYTEFLTSTERYKVLFTLDAQDYKSWAYGLKEAGYATNPAYAELLIGAIEKYNLNRFDKVSLADYRKKLK